MPKASRLDWQVALSHTFPDGFHRCLSVPFGRVRIHFCSRCSGMYPAMALGFFSRLADMETPEPLALVLRLIVPLVGAAGWTIEQSGRDLSRPVRIISGMMLGLGLGWVLGLHVRLPWPRELFELGAGLGLALIIGLLFKVTHRPARNDLSLLPVSPEITERKNQDEDLKNEVDPKAS